MFKISKDCRINPRYVMSVTTKRPNNKQIFFAITLEGNGYHPSRTFSSSEEASDFLKKLMEAVDEAS